MSAAKPITFLAYVFKRASGNPGGSFAGKNKSTFRFFSRFRVDV